MDDDREHDENEENEDTNSFDKENIKHEIDDIIDGINHVPSSGELNKNTTITIFNLISVNAGMIVKLSKLLATMSENINLHGTVLIKYTKSLPLLKKYVIISLITGVSALLVSLFILLYVLSSQ